MQMTESQRNELAAARDAWDEARERYAGDARKYVVAWFEGDTMPEKALDREGLDTLTRLNEDILTAQYIYAAIVKRIRGEAEAAAPCQADDHDWEPLAPSKVTGAYIVVDGERIPIPLAETPLPTHQCTRCGIVAVPRL